MSAPLRLALLVALLAGGCSTRQASQPDLCGAEGQGCCEAEVCGRGLACVSGSCVACGGVDEACCGGESCRAGGECTLGSCTACGGVDEPCCGGRSCRLDLACSSGSCRPLCGAACELGSQRCNAGGGVDRCEYNPGDLPCRRWTTVLSTCGDQARCEVGRCVERCPGGCEIGAAMCATQGPGRCTLDPGTGCGRFVSDDRPEVADRCLPGFCSGPVCFEQPTPASGDLSAAEVGRAGLVLLALDDGSVMRGVGSDWFFDVDVLGRETLDVHHMTSCTGTLARVIGWGDGAQAQLPMRRFDSWSGIALPGTGRVLAAACDILDRLTVVQAGRLFVVDDADNQTRPGDWLPSGGLPLDPLGASPGWVRAASATRTDLLVVGAGGTLVGCNTRGGGPWSCGRESTELARGAELKVVRLEGNPISGGVRRLVGGAQGTLLYDPGDGRGLRRVAEGATVEEFSAVALDPDTDTALAATPSGLVLLKRAGSDQWASTGLPTRTSPSIIQVAFDGIGAGWVISSSLEAWTWPDLTTSSSATDWRLVVGRGVTADDLNAVTVVGADDVWAVGKTAVRRRYGAWAADPLTVPPVGDITQLISTGPAELFGSTTLGGVVHRTPTGWVREGLGLVPRELSALASDGARLQAVGKAGSWIERDSPTGTGSWRRVVNTVTSNDLLAVQRAPPDTTGVSGWFAIDEQCRLIERRGDALRSEPIPQCVAPIGAAAAGPLAGELWIADEEGLMHLSGGRWTRAPYPAQNNDPLFGIPFALTSCPGGGVVISRSQVGLQRYEEGAGWRLVNPGRFPFAARGLTCAEGGVFFAVGERGAVVRGQ